MPLSTPSLRLLPRVSLLPVVLAVSLLFAWNNVALRAQQPFSDQQLEFFESKVRPLLVERCYECHGPEADPPEGNLSLTSRASIISGGDSGPAIDPGHPAKSLLIDAVQYGELFEMPPDFKLPETEIEILRQWVEMNAPWPDEATVAAGKMESFNLEKRRAEHWCWQLIFKPPLPKVSDGKWPLDPLDYFILAKLESNGLTPAKPADRATWIRRVYLDLIGLPPTPAQIDEFVRDESPHAHEKVVDDLLGSDRFGERWARHWMDLIRYAETCGHEFDYPIPHAHQYRDYLIRAFNEDVPYDELIIEHIAGDLIKQPRRNPDNQINESILGTGFWYLGEATHAPVDVKGDEAGHVDNQIDVMSKTFLGLTVACARCHDHKFDAISTEDYYALSGFLQSSRRQDVMLDPGGRIEAASAKAKLLVREADDALRDFVKSLSDASNEQYWDKLPEYLEASVIYLQQDPGWQFPDKHKIEGESLKPASRDGGEVKNQRIDDHDGFQWSGAHQLWWGDGKVGDSIEMEIKIPNDSEFEFSADFTKGPAYGIVQVSLDGNQIGEPIDLYDRKVSKTGKLQLGNFQLNAGKHRIRLSLTGTNEQALPRNMVGVDYFHFERARNASYLTDRQERLDNLADRYGLEPDFITKWASAIQDPGSERQQSPLFVLRQAAKSTIDLTSGEAADGFFRTLLKSLAQQWSEDQRFDEQSVPFERFSNPAKMGWFETGFAFTASTGTDQNDQTESDEANRLDMHRFDPLNENSPLLQGGVVHSGLLGTRFQGVLRSTTFEIQHPFIHYRIAGKDTRIRLIIDGYTLDLNNPLLFNGMSFNVNSPNAFKWHVQGSDLKKYIGHRAHIEIIDQGDGWVAIDEIRFSDQASPPTDVNLLLQSGLVYETPDREASDEVSKRDLTVVAHGFGAYFRNGVQQPNHRLSQQIWNLFFQHDLFPAEGAERLRDKLQNIRQQLAKLNQQTPRPTLAIGMTDGSPENEYVFIRGNHRNLGPEVDRRPMAALLDAASWDLSGEPGSGRMQLARHVASQKNPLTSRVIVNRLWHHLTGRGIVPSVDNFGVLGQRPSHPQLLDYLASEFVEDGWSIKRMLRRMVLSQTYRMSSMKNSHAEVLDPNNGLMHRARVRRLQGEAIRDMILFVSGELDDKMYGPGVPIHLTSFMQGRGRPGKSGPLDGDRRRSIYIEVRRNFLPPMMLAFDTPIPFNSIGRRNVSNVPAQALILMNDPFVVDQAQKWAGRIVRTDDDAENRIRKMFMTAIGRSPTDTERQNSLNFLTTQAAELGIHESQILSNQQLWADLCHVLFNMKEFIFLR